MGSRSRSSARQAALAAALSAVVVLSACATASPRQRPLDAGPVETGAGSLQATRRQLEGTWTLTRFEVTNPGGQLTPVRASAKLTYDGFGNLSIVGRLEEPMPGQATITDQPALAYTGKAVIDTVRQEMVLTGTTTNVETSPDILEKIGLESRRKYALSDGTLTISIVDAGGGVTARATFRK
jgi:hypothetical protein